MPGLRVSSDDINFGRSEHEPFNDSYFEEPRSITTRNADQENKIFDLEPEPFNYYPAGSAVISLEILRQLREIQQNFDILIPSSNNVCEYLGQYSHLNEILFIICKNLKEEFKFDAQISLEIYRDPEINDEHLCLYVRQAKYDKELMKRIRKVSKFSNKLLRGVFGWVHITSDGRPPM